MAELVQRDVAGFAVAAGKHGPRAARTAVVRVVDRHQSDVGGDPAARKDSIEDRVRFALVDGEQPIDAERVVSGVERRIAKDTIAERIVGAGLAG